MGVVIRNFKHNRVPWTIELSDLRVKAAVTQCLSN